MIFINIDICQLVLLVMLQAVLLRFPLETATREPKLWEQVCFVAVGLLLAILLLRSGT